MLSERCEPLRRSLPAPKWLRIELSFLPKELRTAVNQARRFPNRAIRNEPDGSPKILQRKDTATHM